MKAEKAAKEKEEKQKLKAAQDAEKKVTKNEEKKEEILDPSAYFENRSKAVTHLKTLKD